MQKSAQAMRTRAEWATRLVALAAGLMAAAVAAAACGAEPAGDVTAPTETFQRITASERVYTVDDFRAADLKANKSYDVTNLPHVVAAWHGVFSGKDFEVRFYASHRDAVEFGAGPAEHVSGKDGVVSGPDVMWEEGERDRRKCVPRAGLSEHGCLQTARYADYVIVGNAVVLCEGLDSETALEACAALLGNLD